MPYLHKSAAALAAGLAALLSGRRRVVDGGVRPRRNPRRAGVE
ncbi:hypothetical protein [Massilia phosphatilytica]